MITDNGQKSPDSEFAYIDIGSINNKSRRLGNLSNVLTPEKAPSRAREIVKKGDGVYSTVRSYLHSNCVIDIEIEPPHICDILINDASNSRGVAYPAIPESKLKRIPIPLPPINEQKRIVSTLDKFLSLCEGLVQP